MKTSSISQRIKDAEEYVHGELWRPTTVKPSWFVSNLGRVFSTEVNRILKPFDGVGGPARSQRFKAFSVRTGKNKYKTIYVHRLVAEAFCRRGSGCTEVLHINGNRHDNNAVNLLWVTPKARLLLRTDPNSIEAIRRRVLAGMHKLKKMSPNDAIDLFRTVENVVENTEPEKNIWIVP